MARIRSSSEVDDDESGEDSYVSQSRRNAKRPRTDNDVSDVSLHSRLHCSNLKLTMI